MDSVILLLVMAEKMQHLPFFPHGEKKPSVLSLPQSKDSELCILKMKVGENYVNNKGKNTCLFMCP